jgi:hypothetical protein
VDIEFHYYMTYLIAERAGWHLDECWGVLVKRLPDLVA